MKFFFEKTFLRPNKQQIMNNKIQEKQPIDIMFFRRHLSNEIMRRFLISKVKNAFWTADLLSN